MLFLVRIPRIYIKIKIKKPSLHDNLSDFFFFTFSGKVIDGLLIVRKIEVKSLVIFIHLCCRCL